MGLERKERVASGQWYHSGQCTRSSVSWGCEGMYLRASRGHWLVEQGECCRSLRKAQRRDSQASERGRLGGKEEEREREWGEGGEEGKEGNGGGWSEEWEDGDKTWRDSCLDFQWLSSPSKTQSTLFLHNFRGFMVTCPFSSWLVQVSFCSLPL